MPKKFQISVSIALVFFGLLFLCLRENEARVSAEAKLEKLKLRLHAQDTVKTGAITDLQAQGDDLRLKLQDASEKYQAMLEEKNGAIERFGAEARQSAQSYEAQLVDRNLRISDLEAASRQDNAKFNASLKEKNTQLSQLGVQLQENSAKLSALLRQQETLEASNLDGQARILALGNELARLKRHNEELLRANKNQQVKAVSLD